MYGRRSASPGFFAFFVRLLGRGGLKRAIFLPFAALLAVAFGASWRFHVDGSRKALLEMSESAARSLTDRINSDLTLYLSAPRKIADILAAQLSEVEEGAYFSQFVYSIDGFPATFARQLADYPSLGILSVGMETGEYAEAQRLQDGTVRFGRAGRATDGALVLYTTAADGSRIVRFRKEGYDPRKRPWYRAALETGDSAWCEPYAFVSTGAPAAAATRVIRDAKASRVLGVLSASVELASISAFLSSMEELEGGGAAIVVDGKGRTVAASLGSETAVAADAFLRPVGELPPPYGELFSAALSLERGAAGRILAGSDAWRVVASPVREGGPSWTIIAALPESRFLKSLAGTGRRAALVYALAFLTALLIALAIAHGITLPLRTLGAAAAAFSRQIDGGVPPPSAEERELARLERRTDELGRLAASFSSLRSHLTGVFKELNASIDEKNALLKEVHHRVKNNLQIVSSLMSLQADDSADPVFSAAMRTLQDRVRAMAVVHETLYSSGDIASVAMDGYLRRVADSLSAYVGPETDISLAVCPGGVALALEKAVSCGLIAVELVSNAVKHAFPDRRAGRVELSLRREDASLLLTVADDGVGMPESDEAGKSSGGGMGGIIVAALAAQLQGSYAVRPNRPGTSVEIRFPAGAA